MQHNVPVHMVTYEVSALPSESIPDQAWTLSEILQRHAKGMLTDTEITRHGEYGGNDHDSIDYEKLRASDMVDRTEYMDRMAQNIENRKKAFADEKKARKEPIQHDPTPDPVDPPKPDPAK